MFNVWRGRFADLFHVCRIFYVFFIESDLEIQNSKSEDPILDRLAWFQKIIIYKIQISTEFPGSDVAAETAAALAAASLVFAEDGKNNNII